MLASLLPRRWRTPVLAALGLCVAAGALARLPTSRAAENTQIEYAFLKHTVPLLPKECTIVMADRFMAQRLVSTEFPTWLLGGRSLTGQSDFLSNGETAAHGCRFFYFGLSCQSFNSAETPPRDGIRPECRALEARYEFSPEVESRAANTPDGFLRVPNSRLRFGFYRRKSRDSRAAH
jgi:hypothetical protein